MLLFIALTLSVIFTRYPRSYSKAVTAYSNEFGLESELVYAVINVESSFNPRAKSNKGATGLMQLMPSTAKWCADNLKIDYTDEMLYDPSYNIRLGAYYLRYLLDKFGSETLALTAYNAGEGNLKKWLESGESEIPFPETERYVKKVLFAKKIYEKRI